MPTYPRDNHVLGNHIHDIGLWTKQVAGFTQFVSARTTVARNTIYNTPRAGINLNDNFGGGNVLERNAVFNTVRETNDHGPINSWSRQGWVTTEGPPGPGEEDGHASPSTAVSWNLIKQNLVGGFSANEHGGMPLDYDDGTEYMHSVANVLVYGGLKSCWHSNNQRYENNLIVRPDLGRLGPQACSNCIAGAPDAQSYQQRSSGGRWPKNESKHGDTCITETGEMYRFAGACNPADLNGTALFSTNSTYYSTVTPTVRCDGVGYNLSGWHALWASAGLGEGGEGGSVHVRTALTTDAIAALVRERLGLEKR